MHTHHLRIGDEARDALRPRQVVYWGRRDSSAILIGRDEHTRHPDSYNRSLLLAPLLEHVQRTDQEARLVLGHGISNRDGRRATSGNIAESIQIPDCSNLQADWKRGIAGEGRDLFRR